MFEYLNQAEPETILGIFLLVSAFILLIIPSKKTLKKP
ncbi:MAG: hypothetical protein UR25_C0002G0053 [Candidatus Nomurabacteria bacterium GW2011_GWE1_32_28]|uniref:Uncharacterized protein n=1 Tax=Candidatus Nomurabacteria bacterium GW2011_GWF1_31_48 TaxID=1618767 RepID=A0A0G0BHK3_9BACT|nr:MAG: hypothetical protein UR10_C0002G0053 [Candidatus Nomurabacteria bacterium GW2011_GWF2_30_133]KKP29058.1 MAG: hypothetical protein UR18_C0001G0179 [Candidatus Nomurabacteria bacterium GW2011_GWE2_31_40]KKP30532.1 MAG: hypothetical protein UR19_C0002G0053 [Candidatus Nomurabacteria bacterium GW2011_GWF1_31_48]KKP35017.1 MAG: hypothetical protein UR25_C0002G0053 [Candidatus Nomurabacteria bacterium GW2011_GWE1_32_28]